MKPHEETWDNGMDFEVTVSGPELDRGIDAPRELLARFAPDMARALLAVRRPESGMPCWCITHQHPNAQHEEECELARAALTKAGVMP